MLLNVVFSLLLLANSFSTSAGITLTKERCEAISHAAFHASSCFVIPTVWKNRVDAINYCNHFPNGHLAYITTQKTMDIITNLADDPTFSAGWQWDWYKIGLFQVDTSDEPNGGWAWDHPDGRIWNITDNRLLLISSAKQMDNYNNGDHIGYYFDISPQGLTDGNNAVNGFICEYEINQKGFKSAGKDQMGYNGTHLAQSFENDDSACAIRCHKELLCRGFSYKQADGHCILHLTTSDGIPALAPTAATGYEMYDTYY